jgi:predicted TPR repeat methyltransferase
MTTPAPYFDDYSENYDAALAESLAVTGEDKDFFARGRVSWVSKCLKDLQVRALDAMDFGCGIGSTTPHLLHILKADSVLGVDVSRRCLELAEQKWGCAQIKFASLDEYQPSGKLDLVYTSGVFHHIPKDRRLQAFDLVLRALRPGGLFAFWENNPLNPGTRYVMSQCEFDKDAMPLTPFLARRLLKASGFEVVQTDYLFFFPRQLRWFRSLEPALSRIPFGGQYQVLCRKSVT